MKQKKKHIFLLGAPAVGKLTIARLLSERTGYLVFDNAKTIDIARLLYRYGTQQFKAFRDDLRFRFYTNALVTDINGLISTYCYRHPDNWRYLTAVQEIMESHGWFTIYLLLVADKSELMRRVQSPERCHKATLHSPQEIDEWLLSSPSYTDVEQHSCIIIDTTVLSAEDVANQILAVLEVPE